VSLHDQRTPKRRSSLAWDDAVRRRNDEPSIYSAVIRAAVGLIQPAAERARLRRGQSTPRVQLTAKLAE